MDSYSNFVITTGSVPAKEVANVQERSTSNPLVLKPGQEYTIRGRMTSRDKGSVIGSSNFGRIYEYGFNPPVGSTLIEGTAKKYNADGKGHDSLRAVFSVGNDDGTDKQIRKEPRRCTTRCSTA